MKYLALFAQPLFYSLSLYIIYNNMEDVEAISRVIGSGLVFLMVQLALFFVYNLEQNQKK